MFTKTQVYILECLASEYSKDEIMEELEISENALVKHLCSIRKALGIPDWTRGTGAYLSLCDKAKALFLKSEMYTIDT